MKTEPEKGQLELDLKVEGIEDRDVLQAIETIQKVSKEALYHWKTFPINLPSSIVDNKDICMKDLFILPTFDELDVLVADRKGNPKFLTHNQLQSIRRKGQFTVTSINFPGQNHVWKLSPFLQKGIDTAREEHLDSVAYAARFILVYTPLLLSGKNFSLEQSIISMKQDLIEIFDLIIGYGKIHSPNLEKSIFEERCKYLVAELKCKGEGSREVGRYVRNQSQKAMKEKVTMAMERPPSIPFRFTTPISLDIDLRLFDRDIMRKLAVPLIKLLEKSSRGWFLIFRERVISELKTRKLPDNEMELQANQMVMDEYLRRVYNGIRNCDNITSTGTDIDRLLIEQAQIHVLMHRAIDNVAVQLDVELQDAKKYYLGEYPVISRDEAWLSTQIEHVQKKFLTDNKWLPHEIALELSRQNFLKQHSYFLARDLAFMKDTEPVLRKELKVDHKPRRIFQWKIEIWRPEKYVIHRRVREHMEVIPTVISEVPTTITSPRTDQPVYEIEKARLLWTTTRWPLWRIQNLCFRTLTWMLNLMLFLGYVIPWRSIIGVQALVRPKPFIPDFELSQVNGTLCPKKSSQTSTLTSRLTTIWRRVSKARTRFESQPDASFLGQGWNRFVNRVWNYGFKGFIPTFALLIFFPLASVLCCLVSVICALLAPLWVPLAALGFHFVCILFYDFDCPENSERLKWFPLLYSMASFLVQGLLQSIVCSVGAVILCPLASIIIFLYTAVSYGIRVAWDYVLYYAVIKPKARLPSVNSWTVKRIMGPGLEPEFFFEISVEQALMALQARLDTDELSHFYENMKQRIFLPQKKFEEFFSSFFTPFSGKLMESEGPYQSLIKETQSLKNQLEEKVMKRKKQLEHGLNVSIRSRIRMRKPLLERTLLIGAKLCEKFFTNRIFKWMDNKQKNEFWESRGLTANDWNNLSITLFCEIFCQDFLTPLEENDVSFRLETGILYNSVPAEYFISSLEEETWYHASPMTMSKINYQIHSPFLDVSVFNPMSRPSQIWSEDNFKFCLVIPLPILHPAHISAIIYNRETDHPFDLNNPICQAILKALQESGPTLNQDCISLDVDDSSSSESESSSLLSKSSPATREDLLGLDYSSPSAPTSSSMRVKSQGFLDLPVSGRRNPSTATDYSPSTSYSSRGMDLKEVGTSGGKSSKISLATPEDINLDEVILAGYGTSV